MVGRLLRRIFGCGRDRRHETRPLPSMLPALDQKLAESHGLQDQAIDSLRRLDIKLDRQGLRLLIVDIEEANRLLGRRPRT